MRTVRGLTHLNSPETKLSSRAQDFVLLPLLLSSVGKAANLSTTLSIICYIEGRVNLKERAHGNSPDQGSDLDSNAQSASWVRLGVDRASLRLV
ncbi:MAG TPA: hypothetical protein VI386_18620 [Candidatus Sulfotelmatobacter sp.]